MSIKTQSVNKTAKITIIAILGSLSAILMFFEIPLPFIAPDFYKLDFSELPVLIGGFCFGPLTALIIEVVKILLILVLKGTITMGVGELANLAIGCSFVIPATLIYKYKRTKFGAVVGMVVGTFCMTAFGALANGIVLLPTYVAAFNMDIGAIVDMGKSIHKSIDSIFKFCLLTVAPFNFFKGTVTSIITYIVYKPLSKLINNKFSTN